MDTSLTPIANFANKKESKAFEELSFTHIIQVQSIKLVY